ncbi:hypothetical protein Hdeb2414_s0035g00727771 [Helianthus debilis subsp. tardiflorus]
MSHVLFLGNQLGDVETLLGQRIPLGRDFLFSLLHTPSLSPIKNPNSPSLQSSPFSLHKPCYSLSFFSNKVVSLILSSNLLFVETPKVTPTNVDLTPVYESHAYMFNQFFTRFIYHRLHIHKT